jgi:type IV secretion system protein VirB10
MYLRTIFPVSVDNNLIIPVGTYVQGVITEVKRPGRVKGRAEVLFRFTTLVYPDGYTVTIPGALNSVPGAENSRVKDKEGTVQANGTKGRDAGTIAETSAGGAAIGGIEGGWKGAGIGGGIGAAAGTALVLLTRGQDVRLEAGSTVEMVLQRDLVLDDVNSHSHYYSGPPSAPPAQAERPSPPPRETERAPRVRPVLVPGPER